MLTKYAAQSGLGAAVPTHANCCTALGKPVLSIALPIAATFGVLWNMPMPPRTVALGPRNAPSNPPICAPDPYVHENPRRGLREKRFGTLSFATPKICSTCELGVGSDVNRLPSRRTPYVTCKSLFGRYESPSDSAPTYSLSLRLRGDSWRVNVAGRPASRSASELKLKLPRRFNVRSCAYWSRRSSVPNLI